MILTLTPNPALDVTYHVNALEPGATHRVRAVHRRAGGKGLNVSRVLHEQGAVTRVLAPCGGASGGELRADLDAAGIAHALLPVATPTRSTVAVVADGDEATLFNEPGQPLADPDWERLGALVADHLAHASVLVCSGRLPPGTDPGHLGSLVRAAHAAGAPVLVDTSGPALQVAAEAGADVLKPNADELRDATGQDDPRRGAEQLRELGAGAVVGSLGPSGLLAVTGRGTWHAGPPREIHGNPTGAGDAAVGALALGMARGDSWPERLRVAAAWSAAAVAAPIAGSLDPGVLAELHVQDGS
ncbi:MAG: 1-phosphofructokinase family hexose kinase [Streptosporangiaceae bacterium]